MTTSVTFCAEKFCCATTKVSGQECRGNSSRARQARQDLSHVGAVEHVVRLLVVGWRLPLLLAMLRDSCNSSLVQAPECLHQQVVAAALGHFQAVFLHERAEVPFEGGSTRKACWPVSVALVALVRLCHNKGVGSGMPR